jgi:cytochrome c oxidase assembly protein subunit 15
VVAHELAPWIVTAHLVVAILIVLLLLYATVYAIYRLPVLGASSAELTPRRLLVAVVVLTMAVTLVQMALGTQVRGTIDDALHAGVARAAALGTVGWFDGAHRTLALAVMSLALVSLLVVWARHPLERRIARWTYLVVGLAGAQVVLCLVLAYVALAPAVQVSHLTVSSLLMGAQMVQLLVASWD